MWVKSFLIGKISVSHPSGPNFIDDIVLHLSDHCVALVGA
jgi:hypothetical protein